MEYTLLSTLYYQDRERYETVYQKRFHSDYAVHLDFEVNGNPAFFLQTPELYAMLTDILRMNQEVSKLVSILPAKAIFQFTRRCLIDEIVLTNSIEGVRSTRKEISAILDELEERSRGKRFYGLVKKYTMLQTTDELPLESCADIRAIYDELVLPEIRAEDQTNVPDGKWFRKELVSILSPSQKEIHKGLYPEAKIIHAMEQALAFLHDKSCDILFRLSIFHYLLEYIHPFYDGNGRLGRFICSYLLSRELEPVTGYRLSYTVKENIREYNQAFSNCNEPRNRGDLTPFAIMFLRIIQESVFKLRDSLEDGNTKWNYYTDIIKSSGLIGEGDPFRVYPLYDLLVQATLFSESGIQTKIIMDVLDISRGTLTAKLEKIPSGLLVKQKIANTNYYSLDLKALDEWQKPQ